jgi:hypothetical protein
MSPARKCGQNVPRLGRKPAKTFLGSRPRFTAAIYRQAIRKKLDAGLSLQRIWQDLVEEYGYSASYDLVKRCVQTIAPTRPAVDSPRPGHRAPPRRFPRRCGSY